MLVWPFVLAIAAAPAVQIGTASALADVPVGIMFALSGIFAWRWLFDGDRVALQLFALFGAGAYATKFEGRIFVVALSVTLIALDRAEGEDTGSGRRSSPRLWRWSASGPGGSGSRTTRSSARSRRPPRSGSAAGWSTRSAGSRRRSSLSGRASSTRVSGSSSASSSWPFSCSPFGRSLVVPRRGSLAGTVGDHPRRPHPGLHGDPARAPRAPVRLGAPSRERPGAVRGGARAAPPRGRTRDTQREAAATGSTLCLRTAVLFTCAGQRVDIVTAFKRAGATTIASDLDRLAPALYHADHMALVPRVDRSRATSRRSRRSSPSTTSSSSCRSPTSTRASSRAAATQLEPALLLAPPYEVCATMADKYVAHVFFEEHGIESPRTWLPGEVPDDARYPAARQDPRGLRLASHLPRRRRRRSSRSSSVYAPGQSMVQEMCVGDEFSIDVFCDLEGRCLNAIARTMIQSKGGESIKGMSTWITPDRARAPGGRDDRHCRAGLHPVLPGAGRLAARDRREPALRRRVPVADSRPGAATRSSRSRSRTASGPSRRVGDYRAGVSMTRFYSEVCLVEDGGELRPLER